jgi:hypothetical protein
VSVKSQGDELMTSLIDNQDVSAIGKYRKPGQGFSGC